MYAALRQRLLFKFFSRVSLSKTGFENKISAEELSVDSHEILIAHAVRNCYSFSI